MARLLEQQGRWRELAAVLAVAVVLHNVGYLWLRKRAQFAARAEPTGQLIRMARATGGPIWVRCFPLAPITAESALRLGAGLPANDIEWTEAEARERPPASVYCADRR